MIGGLFGTPLFDLSLSQGIILLTVCFWACNIGVGRGVKVAAIVTFRIFGKRARWGKALAGSAEIGDVLVDNAESLIHDRRVFPTRGARKGLSDTSRDCGIGGYRRG